MESFFPLILILVPIVGLWWEFSRSRTIIDEWAESQGLDIVHTERRWLFRGPFCWFTSDAQTVYYVTVRDGNGIERSGYLRCGGFFFGLFSNKAEIRWDE